MNSVHSYEVEVKSLLGSSERAAEVRAALKAADPSTALLNRNKQLNHYFVGSTLETLVSKASRFLLPGAANRLSDIAKKSKESSVRTRDKDGEVFLVVKASIDETSNENGVARLEFEEPVNLSLEELDALLISAGYQYQAKWSREREEYTCDGINITLDKNAGYGWVAEFEKMVTAESEVADARKTIDTLMQKIQVLELPQDRLARMFDFYNKHWAEYYGTENIFTIE